MQSQVLYVVPITSILGRLALVPVGATGTIPFSMRKETGYFPGASCDSKKGAGDGGPPANKLLDGHCKKCVLSIIS